MKPLLVRWTIGNVQPEGYKCLVQSVLKLQTLYEIEIVIYYNGHLPIVSSNSLVQCIDQTHLSQKAKGVAWKLYPPRHHIDRHEIFIDNDLIIDDYIDEIEVFRQSDCTLLLEGMSRNYGRFDKMVPNNYIINSGIFGIPPGFCFEKYINFFGENWEKNASEKSFTFDEQGLIATALLDYPKFVIIPNTTITNCETKFRPAKGMHFIGLNRRQNHRPWKDYQFSKIPTF